MFSKETIERHQAVAIGSQCVQRGAQGLPVAYKFGSLLDNISQLEQ